MLPVDPNFNRVNNAYTTKQRKNIHDFQIKALNEGKNAHRCVNAVWQLCVYAEAF